MPFGSHIDCNKVGINDFKIMLVLPLHHCMGNFYQYRIVLVTCCWKVKSIMTYLPTQVHVTNRFNLYDCLVLLCKCRSG